MNLTERRWIQDLEIDLGELEKKLFQLSRLLPGNQCITMPSECDVTVRRGVSR